MALKDPKSKSKEWERRKSRCLVYIQVQEMNVGQKDPDGVG